MMDKINYSFTELDQHKDLLEEINRLESKMTEKLHQEVRLIAYSHRDEMTQQHKS